ncbi:hypothetical protein PBI_MA5_5 [Mycobacterium phage MA5]|uniref:Glycine-rich domain-containing protein n=1 Tax=Mycobacterium phage MA5 TaxID=2725640 RepID=A0A6M3T1W8_9CAUD|nr:minor tail protein [Mycobacterium phage MA5]QJD52059.1 hypothetical protein PBI_MA5_5 [Mycobacterium phage MA5]
MPIYLGSTALNNFRVGTQTPDRIFLGNELVWPAFTPLSDTITATGSYAWNIPANCRFIDIVVIGGGGGGQASLAIFNYGDPGDPGHWNGITLKRGVDIPWGDTQITGEVGGGGIGGPGPSISPGFMGGNTTATWSTGSITGGGGAGGLGWASSAANTAGPSPGNFVWNGITYTGGAKTGTGTFGPGGNPPGGARASSTGFGAGGQGARGQVWFRAY